MKKTMKKMAGMAGIITLLSLGNACAGDDNHESDEKVRIEQTLDASFLNDDWEYESITADTPEDYNGDGNKSTDILSQYPEEEKDNVIGFIPNGLRYEIYEDGVKNAKVIEKGTYSIDQDNNKIIMISEEGDRTVFRKVRALQDNNGFGHTFLQYRDQEDHLVVRKAVDIF